MNWLRWKGGRQDGGYRKMLLATMPFPLPFDCYLIQYPEGSSIPPHVDPVTNKRHYRLNIILRKSREGGEFICKNPIFETERIKLFRPDVSEHQVTKVVGGSRYVLSIGWVLTK